MYENTVKALETYGDIFIKKYKASLEKNGRRATGNLLNSIVANVRVGDNNIQVILSLADYYQWIEDGRPPTTGSGDGRLEAEILEWIKAKPILPREQNGKLPTEQQLAFLIARKIHREGFKGTHDLMQTKYEMEGFEEIIKQALIQDFKAEFKDLLK